MRSSQTPVSFHQSTLAVLPASKSSDAMNDHLVAGLADCCGMQPHGLKCSSASHHGSCAGCAKCLSLQASLALVDMPACKSADHSRSSCEHAFAPWALEDFLSSSCSRIADAKTMSAFSSSLQNYLPAITSYKDDIRFPHLLAMVMSAYFPLMSTSSTSNTRVALPGIAPFTPLQAQTTYQTPQPAPCFCSSWGCTMLHVSCHHHDSGHIHMATSSGRRCVSVFASCMLCGRNACCPHLLPHGKWCWGSCWQFVFRPQLTCVALTGVSTINGLTRSSRALTWGHRPSVAAQSGGACPLGACLPPHGPTP
jgi:hypothetical protein